MTKTALLVAMTLVLVPLSARAGQTQVSPGQQVSSGQQVSPGQTTGGAQTSPTAVPAAGAESAAQTSDEALPVSLDRIRKALKTDASQPSTIEKRLDTEDGIPRFAVRTESPRTLKLSDFLADNRTAVPAHVRPPFDPYHYEFLEMVTPDEVKGCAQFDNAACSQAYFSRLGTGLMWQQLVGSGLRGLFAKP